MSSFCERFPDFDPRIHGQPIVAEGRARQPSVPIRGERPAPSMDMVVGSRTERRSDSVAKRLEAGSPYHEGDQLGRGTPSLEQEFGTKLEFTRPMVRQLAFEYLATRRIYAWETPDDAKAHRAYTDVLELLLEKIESESQAWGPGERRQLFEILGDEPEGGAALALELNESPADSSPVPALPLEMRHIQEIYRLVTLLKHSDGASWSSLQHERHAQALGLIRQRGKYHALKLADLGYAEEEIVWFEHALGIFRSRAGQPERLPQPVRLSQEQLLDEGQKLLTLLELVTLRDQHLGPERERSGEQNDVPTPQELRNDLLDLLDRHLWDRTMDDSIKWLLHESNVGARSFLKRVLSSFPQEGGHVTEARAREVIQERKLLLDAEVFPELHGKETSLDFMTLYQQNQAIVAREPAVRDQEASLHAVIVRFAQHLSKSAEADCVRVARIVRIMTAHPSIELRYPDAD